MGDAELGVLALPVYHLALHLAVGDAFCDLRHDGGVWSDGIRGSHVDVGQLPSVADGSEAGTPLLDGHGFPPTLRSRVRARAR